MSGSTATPAKGTGIESGSVLRTLWRRFDNSPFSIRNISLVYVWALLFLLFSLWVPDTFLNGSTWKSLAAEQAVTAILALAVVVSIASGIFDLSLAAVLGAAAVLVSHLMIVNGLGPVPATLLTLVGAILIGALSATVVVVFRVNSFIATLGVSSILTAFIAGVSNNQQIVGLPETFTKWTTFQLLGIQGAFWIALGLAAIVWFVMEHRPAGRYMYATGGNIEAARLAGVRTKRVIFGTMICAALTAGLAGIVVTSRLGTSSPTIGPPYLLPAFAAAFLGSTQVRPGRFNVLGTLIAVYALATSVKGLQLAGAPFWLPELFNGVALLAAVAISVRRKRVTLSVRQDVASAPPAPLPVTLRQASREGVEELRRRTGETVSVISLAGGGDGKIVELAESDAPLRVGGRLGERVPNARFGQILNGGGSHGGYRSNGSQVTIAEDGEVMEAMALIVDRSGATGVLSVRAPLSRLTDEHRETIETGVRETAAVIGNRLSKNQEGVAESSEPD